MGINLRNKWVVLLMPITAVCSFALFSIGAYAYCEKFNKQAITATPFLFCEKWQTDCSREIPSVLKQPYYYIGRGSQCFVFESEDKEWVLKLFRMKRLEPFYLPRALQFSKYRQMVQRKIKKHDAMFHSFWIAYTYLKDECGLLCVHLNPTSHIRTTVVVHDRLGRPYGIDADTTPFTLQKKATPLNKHLRDLVDHQQYTQIAQAMASISNLIVSRCQKGISDFDAEIQKNTGVIEGKPIFIDIGNFYLNPDVIDPVAYDNEQQCVTRKCRQWIDSLTSKQLVLSPVMTK